MSNTLNRTRHYGEVWGGQGAARFVQDGRYFDFEGKQIDFDDKGASVVPKAPQAQAPSDSGASSAALALAERRSALMLKAIPMLEPAQDRVVGELPDLEESLLPVMLEVEGLAKKRKVVIEAIEAEIKRRAEATASMSMSQLGAQLST